MAENDLKYIALDRYTKEELIQAYPTLKQADKKEVLIRQIIDAGYAIFTPGDDGLEVVFKPINVNIPADTYLVMHRILEDGKEYQIGSEYTGKFTERFLKGGQIRKKDK